MLKGWFWRMLGNFRRGDELKRAFGIEKGDSSVMDAARRRWRALYTARGGLGLPAAVAGELARLTTVEMKLKISGGERAELLDEAFRPLQSRLRREMEFGLADGSLIFKPYYDGERLTVDIVRSDCFIPVSWDSGGNVNSAVFSQELKKEDVYYTRLEYHKLEHGRYEIKNAAFKSKVRGELGREVALSEIEEWSGLAESLVLENVKRPLFGFFRTPSANRVDADSPLGAAVFAGAEELMAQADELYENLLWEFRSGKRRLYVDVTAFERGADGKPRLPDTELFRTIDVNDSGFFGEWSPEFRSEAIKSGLNTILQRTEFNCSLAYGTLSEPADTEKTAEEIRASKQRSYCFVCDLQSRLRAALEEAVYAADVWATVYRLAPEGSCGVSIEFDDSIVADRHTEYEEKVKLVELGIMKPWEFRAWYFGEDESRAKAETQGGVTA